MKHLLVVDDCSVDRELVRGLLEKSHHYHVEFASDALEALEHLEYNTPLAVVTDLQMPDMDGLALVKQIRRAYPTIPVILMTAYGSEDLALEALVAGAADFVPKHRLAQDLVAAVESVLSVCAGDRPHDQISQYLTYKKLRYELPADLNLVSALADQLQQTALALGYASSGDRFRLAKCLVEALRNAISHGATKSSAASTAELPRDLTVEVEFGTDEARFTIRDNGPGFDVNTVVDPRTKPTSLTSDKGRGLTLIQLHMDEVRFNAAGNEIVMIKRRAESHLPAQVQHA